MQKCYIPPTSHRQIICFVVISLIITNLLPVLPYMVIMTLRYIILILNNDIPYYKHLYHLPSTAAVPLRHTPSTTAILLLLGGGGGGLHRRLSRITPAKKRQDLSTKAPPINILIFMFSSKGFSNHYRNFNRKYMNFLLSYFPNEQLFHGGPGYSSGDG